MSQEAPKRIDIIQGTDLTGIPDELIGEWLKNIMESGEYQTAPGYQDAGVYRALRYAIEQRGGDPDELIRQARVGENFDYTLPPRQQPFESTE